MFYSLRQAAESSKLNREYIRALCDHGMIDCVVDTSIEKHRYYITEKGMSDLFDLAVKCAISYINGNKGIVSLYFVKAQNEDLVKIGITQVEMSTRLKQLCAVYKRDLHTLYIIDNVDRLFERSILAAFSNFSWGGEWLAFSPPVKKFIELLNSYQIDGFDLSTRFRFKQIVDNDYDILINGFFPPNCLIRFGFNTSYYSMLQASQRTMVNLSEIIRLCQMGEVDCVSQNVYGGYVITERGIRQLDDYYLKSILSPP